MRKKDIIRRVVVFVGVLGSGVAIGGLGSAAWSGKLVAEALLKMKEMELARSHVGSLEAIKSESLETAIWVLNRHLVLIDEFRDISYPQSELDTDALLTHARLARCWDAAGNDNKRDEHVRIGLELAQSSDRRGFHWIISKEDFMVFANGLDDPTRRPASSSSGSELEQ